MMILNWEFNGIAGIYAIECLKNRMIYVGKSINLYDRVRRHKYLLRINKNGSTNINLQRDYNLYGHHNFMGYCLEIVNFPTPEVLTKVENKWIDKIGSYNIKAGNFTDEQRKKLSKSLKGNMERSLA